MSELSIHHPWDSRKSLDTYFLHPLNSLISDLLEAIITWLAKTIVYAESPQLCKQVNSLIFPVQSIILANLSLDLSFLT